MVDRVVTVTLAAQVNNYLANFEKVRQANQKVTKSAEDALAAYERQNQAMEFMGSRLLATGAVVTAATALAVKAAIDWESAWAGVTKTVDGTPEQLSAIEEGLRGLARELPSTHEEIAAVAEAAGQLGVSRENIVAFTRTMIDLSETTNLTADEAATSIAQLMNVMQTAPDDVDNLGAALVALGNDGASTERDIIQMAQRIAGAGRIVGLTEAQVLGFANALASVGIEAEAGGSAISRIMTDIAMSVSAGGEKLDTFASVAAMSSRDFQKAFKDDPADAIATFIEGLARIDAQGGDVFATLDQLGQTDIRVSNALLGMANSGDLLRKSLQLGSVAWKENTALATEAEKRYATTEAKLQIAGNAARDAAIDYGSVFLPALQGVAEVVATLAGGFSGLPEPIQAVVAASVTLATVAALAAGAFLIAVPKIAAFNTQLAILRASEMPGLARAADVATTAIGRTGGALSATARFLTGPWGVALAAAAVGANLLESALDNMRASSEELQNAISTADSGLELFNKTTVVTATLTGGPVIKPMVKDAEALHDALRIARAEGENFLGWLGANNAWAEGARGFGEFREGWAQLSGELAKTPESIGPTFAMLRDEFDLTSDEMLTMINMSEPLKAALTEQATAAGITASDQNILNLVMEGAKAPASDAAGAYKDAADEAKALNDEVLALIDAVNAANGVGQDAVSANARYQESLANISTEIQRQREEYLEPQKKAYEELHGSMDGFVGDLSGFTASLDESTAAGAGNAAMLADVAGSAQDAARAQYELDLKTMSAKDATDKYAATLAAQRQAFVDSALAAGFDADQVQILADKVFGLPDEKDVKIIADAAAARSEIDNFITSYNGKSITIPLKTSQVVVDGRVYGGLRDGRAGGGIIPGPPSDTDNRIYALATGEFVTRARVVANPLNRAVLEYMNDGGDVSRWGRGFANGGYVQPRYADPYGSAASRSAVSPVAAGDVYVQNPWTGEYLVAQSAATAGAVVGAAMSPFKGGRR